MQARETPRPRSQSENAAAPITIWTLSMAEVPAVTVLMSVYNDEKYVREAIDSILAQSFRDFELLVIDDGSTDRTPAILASYDDRRLRVLRNNENIGLTRSLNAGIGAARGPLIARQDADDISYPQRLARQGGVMKRHPPARG